MNWVGRGQKKRRKGRKSSLCPTRQRKQKLFNCPTTREIWSAKPHKELRTRCISCTPLPRESSGDQGNVNALWEKKHMRINVATMITWDPLLIKALFSFVTAEFSYISGKKYQKQEALLFKMHISRVQPGAHTSERAVKRLWGSWPHSQQKTSCLRTRHHLSSPEVGAQTPSSPQAPQYLICCCLPASKQTPVLSIFVGAVLQDLKLMSSDTEIPFMKTTSCSATESWLRKAIYNTSALSLPLKDHWQVQLTPGQTYHCTF